MSVFAIDTKAAGPGGNTDICITINLNPNETSLSASRYLTRICLTRTRFLLYCTISITLVWNTHRSSHRGPSLQWQSAQRKATVPHPRKTNKKYRSTPFTVSLKRGILVLGCSGRAENEVSSMGYSIHPFLHLLWIQQCDMTHAALTAIAVDRGELYCRKRYGLRRSCRTSQANRPWVSLSTPQRVLSLSGSGSLQYWCVCIPVIYFARYPVSLL